MKPKAKVTIAGAGSWGTALAVLLARQGKEVRLWGPNQAKQDTFAHARCNEHYLPGICFPDNLIITNDLPSSVSDSEFVILAVPSIAFADTARAVAPFIANDTPLIWGTKGFDNQSGQFFHQVATDILGYRQPLMVLSGPSFARETALEVPTAVVAASADWSVAQDVANLFSGGNFSIQPSDDVLGVELGGIFKNIIAIAAGIIDGLKIGANTRAALITIAWQEATQLGLNLGARWQTFNGLAGIGDLFLTCMDDQSRNRRFGLALARYKDQNQAHQQVGKVVEGVPQLITMVDKGFDRHCPLPFCQKLYEIVEHDLDPQCLTAIITDSEQTALSNC
jgi:glycerol-3-phosphate dehydrogenase (NAD(P)+)